MLLIGICKEKILQDKPQVFKGMHKICFQTNNCDAVLHPEATLTSSNTDVPTKLHFGHVVINLSICLYPTHLLKQSLMSR